MPRNVSALIPHRPRIFLSAFFLFCCGSHHLDLCLPAAYSVRVGQNENTCAGSGLGQRPLAVLDDYFSVYLGCDIGLIPPGQTVIVASPRRECAEVLYTDPFPVWMIITQSRCAISVRDNLFKTVGSLARAMGLANLRRPEFARQLVLTVARTMGIRQRVGSSSGPILYCTTDTLRMHELHPCRRLLLTDLPAVRESGMLPGPWLEHSIRVGTAFAVFQNTKLVSLAATLPAPHLSEKVAEVSVPGTLEEFRNQGCGRTVVSHTTRAVLETGRIPVYITSDANLASQRTAAAVGYIAYGWQFQIRTLQS